MGQVTDPQLINAIMQNRRAGGGTMAPPAPQGSPEDIPEAPVATNPLRDAAARQTVIHSQNSDADAIARLKLAQNEDARKAAEAQQKDLAPHKMLNAVGSKIDRSVQAIDRIVKHPYLNTLTGSVSGRLPQWANTLRSGQPADDLQSEIDTLKAGATLTELQDLRAASPTGGALGQVSDFEDKLLQNAAGVLQQVQSPHAFRVGLLRYKNQLLQSKQHLEEAAHQDYGTGTSHTPVSAPGTHWVFQNGKLVQQK